MLRFFGQGNMMNVSICEINYWWIERRGVVMGIAGAIVSSMMLGIIPIIMINLINNLGWRSTYQTLGYTCILFMTPLGIIFFRGKPELYGTLPDAKYVNASLSSLPAVGMELVIDASGLDASGGLDDSNDNDDDNSEEEIDLYQDTTTDTEIEQVEEQVIGLSSSFSASTTMDEDEINWTVSEIIHSHTFWVFTLSDLIIAGTATAFFFHLRGAFKESGVSDEMLQSIYPTLAIVSVGGRLFSGWLIDRITQRNVMWIGLLMQAGGLFLVSIMKTDFLAYVVAFLIGTLKKQKNQTKVLRVILDTLQPSSSYFEFATTGSCNYCVIILFFYSFISLLNVFSVYSHYFFKIIKIKLKQQYH